MCVWGRGGGWQESEFFVFPGIVNVVFGQNFNKKSHKIVGNCLHGRVKKKDIGTHPTGMHSCLLPPANEVCEGYVFTGVCLSTGGSTWAGTPPPGQVHPPGRLHPLGRYTPQAGTSPRQVHLPAGTPTPPPGRYKPPLGRYTPQAGTPPATVHAGIQSTSGRYVSHWNAFLFIN